MPFTCLAAAAAMAGLEGLWTHLMTNYRDWVEGAWGILYALADAFRERC